MKNKLFLTLKVLLGTILFLPAIYSQEEAQVSIPFKIYDNAGGQITLYFGLDQSATDGIDFNLGESDLPPFPPTGAFDARWFLPQNNFNGSLSSWKDYRFASGFPFSGTIEHRFRYQSAEGATAMIIEWVLPPTVTGLIQDLANGTILNLPISATGSYQINNFQALNQLKLFVYYNNIVSGIETTNNLPTDFLLNQNFPNPFNPSTTIKFALPESANVTLSIYNSIGEKIKEIVDDYLEAGFYNYSWNAGNAASGIYFYELRTDKFVSIKKMILLK